MAQRKRLTNSAVEAFTCGVYGPNSKHAGKQKEQDVLWCGELKGFGMRLSRTTGVRTYIFVCRVKGTAKEVYVTIGRHRDPWLVEQARAKALELKAQVLNGVNPVEEQERRIEAKRAAAKLDEAQSVTLRQTLESYIENKRTRHGPLRPATKQSLSETIERYLADWLDLPMATTVTRDACLVRFTELSDNAVNQKTGEKGRKGAANMTMTYLRALCNHARDLYENEDGTPRIFAVNPVTRMIKVRKLNPEKARKDRIPRDRIGAVFAMLRKRAVEARTDNERTAADWVTTVLMTGMRLSESGSLLRAQVDLQAKTLRLLGDVVKNHNEIILPLSEPLHKILAARLTAPVDDSPAAHRRKRERLSEYVFPSFGRKKPYISDARATMEALSTVAGCHCSMHSLRRTYEDVLRYSKVDPDVRRVLLNHLADDVHQASYANDDSDASLRPAVEAAAQWILEQAAIAEGGNVIPFPAKTG